MGPSSVVEGKGDAPDLIALIKSLSASPSGDSHARLRRLLERLHPTQLPKVSHRIRAWAGYDRPFDDMTSEQASRMLSASSDPVAVAAALSMHRDGRVRQVAIRPMAPVMDPLVVPFLILRAGDWVEAVRQPALRAVDNWLAAEHIDVLLRSYPLLSGERFSSGRPSEHLPGRFTDLFMRPEAQPSLMRNVASDDATVRRAATRLLIARGATIELLEQAATTRDAVVIGLVARDLPTDGAINDLAGHILLRQRSPRLRQEGLFRLLKTKGPDARPLAEQFMLDRTLTVRATAQRWFAEHAGNVPAYYRSLGPDRRREALLGLGDNADPKDAALAHASLNLLPGTRRAALRLLARLGLPDDLDTFVDSLLLGSEREVREALVWFSQSGSIRAELDSIFQRATDEKSAARVLLRLAPLADNWSQIRLGLRASTDPRLPVRDASVLALRRAVDKPSGFRTPPPDRLSELRTLLEDARSTLDAHPISPGHLKLTDRIDHLLRDR